MITAFPARANRALAPEMRAADTDIDGYIEHTSPHHLLLDVAFPADYYVLGDKISRFARLPLPKAADQEHIQAGLSSRREAPDPQSLTLLHNRVEGQRQMNTDLSVEVLSKAVRTNLQTKTTELIFRELSFDSQRSIYSAVVIVRLHGRDKGYIWIEGKNDLVCCHSNAVPTGPLSSAGRKPFSYKDSELETELRSAISAVLGT
jgi:hypothetical protein